MCTVLCLLEHMPVTIAGESTCLSYRSRTSMNRVSLWTAMVVVALKCTVAAGQVTGCADSEYIISLNESLTPPELVEASNYSVSPFAAPPRNVLYFGRQGDDVHTWCTVSNDTNRHIVIKFTMPVVITGFLSSGSTFQFMESNNTFHATNFTLEYTERNSSGESRFVPYKTALDDDRKYFQQSGLVKLIRLERAIVTDSIRLRIIEWHHYSPLISGGDIACQGVALFGCTAAEGANMTGTELPTAELVVIKDYQALEITLPIAFLTIITVTVVIVVGVLLYVMRKKLITMFSAAPKYEVPLDPPIELGTPETRNADDRSSALYETPKEIAPFEENDESASCDSVAIKFVDNSGLYQSVDEDEVQTTCSEQTGSQTNRYIVTSLVAVEDLEIIYTDAQLPDSRESSDHRNSMELNSAYEFSESMSRENFHFMRNDSYEATDAEN